MAIVISKGKDSSIQQMNVGRICYSKYEMGQAYLNGVKIWPADNVYIKSLDLTALSGGQTGGNDRRRYIPRAMSRLGAITTSASNNMTVAIGSSTYSVIKAYNSLPLLSYNKTTGLWDFASSVNVPASALAGVTQLNFVLKLAAYTIYSHTTGSSTTDSQEYKAQLQVADYPHVATDRLTATLYPYYSSGGGASGYIYSYLQAYTITSKIPSNGAYPDYLWNITSSKTSSAAATFSSVAPGAASYGNEEDPCGIDTAVLVSFVMSYNPGVSSTGNIRHTYYGTNTFKIDSSAISVTIPMRVNNVIYK